MALGSGALTRKERTHMRMHWCTARVNLAGKNLTHFQFHQFDPVSWPELQVIMAMHGGEENVYDIKPIAVGETSVQAEKERLNTRYPRAAVEAVYPGRNPRMEMLMPAESEDLPLADEYGAIASNGNGHPVQEPPTQPPSPPPAPQPEDDDGEEEDAAAPTPPQAVFKPGKHPRPVKGV